MWTSPKLKKVIAAQKAREKKALKDVAVEHATDNNSPILDEETIASKKGTSLAKEKEERELTQSLETPKTKDKIDKTKKTKKK